MPWHISNWIYYSRKTGYKPQTNPRFNVYLTNSLEEYHPDTGTLFASWLSDEAREANHVKRENTSDVCDWQSTICSEQFK
ncbi:MAG: hypothetical protein R3F25_03760 [Gammaproteobacteria bacterium]